MAVSHGLTVSVLILTKNEQQDLPGCLDSVAWSDDIHVYDSGSVDDTVAIAERFGATVTRRSYDDTQLAFGGDEAAHRNWGLRNIPFRHQWLLRLDADERANTELAEEIGQAIRSSEHCAYRIRRRDYLGSTWLEHVQASPCYVRLYRPDSVRYERLINPVTVVDGSVGELTGHFDHYPFSKGLSQWIDKHNHYSTLEARQIIENRRAGKPLSLLKAFAAGDFHERRFHQKELFYRLPCRPLLKFLLLYVAKRGFLDGRAGLTYAVLQAIYEHFIVLKTRELERAECTSGSA